MTIEERIYCGDVVSQERRNGQVYTVTAYAPGSCLTVHAHRFPHHAILIRGAYFERMEGRRFLRLPGDAVYYPELLVHENRFGRLPSECLNIEPGGEPEPVQSSPPFLTRAQEMVEKGLAGSLRDVAGLVGFHPVYVARAYRRQFGVSVGEAIRFARLRRAADRIFASDFSLGEIALEAGFYDQSHLTNEMARTAGFTPGELRRLADL